MLGQNVKRPMNSSSTSGPKYKTNVSRLIENLSANSEGRSIVMVNSRDDSIIHRLTRIKVENELRAKNVLFYEKPDVDMTVPSIFSYTLRSQIAIYLNRKRVNPDDPNLLVDLNLIPQYAEFLFNADREVRPDGQHDSKEAYVNAKGDEAVRRAQSIHYWEKRGTFWANAKWNANNTGPANTRVARLAQVEADRLNEAHDARYIPFVELNHISGLSLLLIDNPLMRFDVAEKDAENLLIDARMVQSANEVRRVRELASMEFEKLSIGIANCFTQYNTDSATFIEVLARHYDTPIMDSIRLALDARNFRLALKTLRERFEVVDDQETIESYTNIMNNLRFNPYSMDFTQFMNIFDLLLEILNSVNIHRVEDATVLYYLKQCMTNCSGDYAKLKTVYDEKALHTRPNPVTFEAYVDGLRFVYTNVLNTKRKHENLAGEEYQRTVRRNNNNNNNNYSINATDFHQHNNGNQSSNTGGRGNNNNGGRSGGNNNGRG